MTTHIPIEHTETHMNYRLRIALYSIAVLGFSLTVPLDGASFTPSIIPLSSEELMNPLRGYYAKGRSEMIPQPEPPCDFYARFSWRDIEPSRDSYNFTPIETEISYALSRGGTGSRFHFRIRCMTSATSGLILVPDYLKNLMEKGWYHTNNTYVPDWNDPDFIDRARALLNALGARYNADPRIGYIDIGIYGLYGEWHMYAVPYPSPTGATLPTVATRRALIDMHRSAFPDKYILMLTETADDLSYAMSISTTVGVRIDSLGNPCCMNDSRLGPALERWKIAPVITEFYGPGNTTPSLALSQLIQYHVSAVSNGNIDGWTTWSSADQATLLELGKRAGYRYELHRLDIPSPLTAGETVPVTSVWRNVGVAPLYYRYDVTLSLIPLGSTAPAHVHTLGPLLTGMLPSSVPVNLHTLVSIPPSLASGTYRVHLAVLDPQQYLRPLKLAIADRQTDGSYALGTIEVLAASGTTNVPPLVTVTEPITGMIFSAPAAISLAADAEDPDDGIARVEFFYGTTLIGMTTHSPYRTTWTNVAPGTYIVRAHARDTRAAVSVSSSVFFTVVSSAAPGNPILIADAYVNSASSTTNYGGDSQLRTKNGSTMRIAYLRFDCSPVTGTVCQALLHLYGFINGSTTAVLVEAVSAADSPWEEHTITWINRPSLGSPISSTTILDSTPRWYVWDVTPYVQTVLAAEITTMTICLRNIQATPEYLVFNSREAAENRPFLSIIRDTESAPGMPPSPPQALHVLFTTTDTIVLSWTDTAVDEQGFHLERTIGTIGSLYVHRATLPANTIHFTDTELPPGTTYTYRIRAYNEAGVSAYSNECMAVTATIPPPTYPLITAAVPWGSGSIIPASGTYTAGTVLTVLAISSDGYNFSHWEGDATGSQNPTYVLLSGTRTVIAVFSPIPSSAPGIMYPVSVAAEPPVGGSVVVEPLGSYFPAGTTLTVRALPAPNYHFVNWEGSLSSAENPLSFVVISSMALTAVFERWHISNQAPAVSLIAPQAYSHFASTSLVTIWATAEDIDGTVVKVDFYAGTTLIGETISSPYRMTWFNMSTGTYTLRAVAWDNRGAAGYSDAIPITVYLTSPTAPLMETMEYPLSPGTVAIIGGPNGFVHATPGAHARIVVVPRNDDFALTVTVFDLRARRLTSFPIRSVHAGEHIVIPWDVSGVPSGIYLAHVRGGGINTAARIVVVRP